MGGHWKKNEFATLYPTERAVKQHRAYIVAQCQARHRGEEWNLSESEYIDAWDPYWDERGRQTHNLTLTRCDWDGAWEVGNIEVITRGEFWHRIHEVQAINREARGI